MIDKNVWIINQKRIIMKGEYDVAIVVDGRFKNEAEEFVKMGALFIRLERPDILRRESICGRDLNDISEVDLDDWDKFLYTINNDTTDKNDLYNKLYNIFKK